MLGSIIILILLLILSGFFSGIELAVFSSNKIKLKTLAKKNPKAKKLLQLKKDSRKLLTTILIGNNVVNIAASAIATVLIVDAFGSYGVGIATGLMTLLILIFGEITPKSYAAQHPEKISVMFTPFLQFFSYLFLPLSVVIVALTRFISKNKSKNLITEEEVKVFVAESVKHGEVGKDERKLIENVFQFNDISVHDVMTPRIEMYCLPHNAKLKDAIKKISNCQFSRIPLYKGSRDNIVGILHIKDVIKFLQKKRNVYLRTIANKPYFVPEHKVINDLFKDLQVKGVHMAIVVDEYGGTAGLVTLEDLIEEIVGEIVDEFDLERDLIMRIDKTTIKVHSGTEIKEINHFFNIHLPGKKTDTISAFVLKRLKKIPRKGEKLKIGNISLIIDSCSKRRIHTVIISKGGNGQKLPL